MSRLADRIPSSEETKPVKLAAAEIQGLGKELGTEWKVIDNHHLEREFSFKNFRQALDFTNQLGEIAETQGHHPDIFLAWGKVRATIYTHSVNGLTEHDFILAAKFNDAFNRAHPPRL